MLQSGRLLARPARTRARRRCTIGGRKFTNSESKSYGTITPRAGDRGLLRHRVLRASPYDRVAARRRRAPDRTPRTSSSTPRWRGASARSTGIDLPGESAGNIADRARTASTTGRPTGPSTAPRPRPATPRSPRPTRRTRRTCKAIATENCAPPAAVYRPVTRSTSSSARATRSTTPLQMAQVVRRDRQRRHAVDAAGRQGGHLADGKVVQQIKPVAEGTAAGQQGHAGVPAARAAPGDRQRHRATTSSRTGRSTRSRSPPRPAPPRSPASRPTSWFATYAPANKPQYAVVMMVSQGGTGVHARRPTR